MSSAEKPIYPRAEDVKTFLTVYSNATGPVSKRSTLKKLLFGEDLPVMTTVIGRLQRLLDDLGLNPPESRRGSGLGLLFALGKSGGLEPTGAAQELKRQLGLLASCAERIRPDVLARMEKKTPPIRIGASTTVATRLLARVFACWPDLIKEQVFSQPVEFEVYPAAPRELLPLLRTGQLNAILGYGAPSGDNDVVFSPLDLKSRMVLLSHPTRELLMRNGEDSNASYGKKYKKEQKPLLYDNLKPIRLNEIDFGETRLLLIPYWCSPKPIASLKKELETTRPGAIQEVNTYDEALALVRMGLGVAPAIEVYCQSHRVHSFKLVPEIDYERDLGVYHHVRHLTQPQKTREAMALVIDYLDQFREYIRNGKPPETDDEEYAKWRGGLKDRANSQNPRDNWLRKGDTLFPGAVEDPS